MADYFKINNICAKYGDIQVLWDVNISVAKGEIVALVGSNGAGKTTTVRNAAGLMIPSSGSIEFDGANMTGKRSAEYAEAGIILVPEGRQLFPEMTVYENLELGAMTKAAKAKIGENVERVFNWFPILKERRKQLAGTLSGGEQQRVAFSRGMMSMPKVLIMDEPSLGLAPNIVDNIFAIAKDIAKEGGLTIILVEQDVRKALKIADRGYVLENGEIRLEGAADDLMHNDEVKKAYLGF